MKEEHEDGVVVDAMVENKSMFSMNHS